MIQRWAQNALTSTSGDNAAGNAVSSPLTITSDHPLRIIGDAVGKPTTDAEHTAIAQEQHILDVLFDYVDTQRRLTEDTMSSVLRRRTRDPRGLLERETDYSTLHDRLTMLSSAEIGLCFGRIDVVDNDDEGPENPSPDNPELDRRYIGRIGISDKDDDYRTLLMDWRAPGARPFYLATTAHPEGVSLRRHLRTNGRTVTHVTDEYLDVDAAAAENQGVHVTVHGAGDESPLLAALNAARTGHMTDIVATIQREQDTIIRDPYRGVTVVEGGPGTGKTAVALHRVAYLLYTWRDVLSATGVLVLGPNRTFIDYISHVLPTLGEGGVVLSTVGDLYPGVTTSRIDSELGREVKGSIAMVEILTRAVRNYQRVPEHSIALNIDGHRVTVTPAMVRTARTRARRSRKPHNRARTVFHDTFLDILTDTLADHIGEDPLGGRNLLSASDHAALRDDLKEETTVVELMDSLWPELDPINVLAQLYSDSDALLNATRDYDDLTRDALRRSEGRDFSTSDAALLDELATIIGVADVEEKRARDERERSQRIAEAQDALDILAGSASQDVDDGFDPEILMAYDILDADALAERQRVRDQRTTAERAYEDRLWSYGHVVIDEAQELSAMEWRMIMRRCPNRWMTLVGDTAQTGSPAGVESWAETLEPFVKSRWHHHRLTVNYRTPKEITDIADHLRHTVAPGIKPDTAIRSNNRHPRFITVPELTSCRLISTHDGHYTEPATPASTALSRVRKKLRHLVMEIARTTAPEGTIAINTAEDNTGLRSHLTRAVDGIDIPQTLTVVGTSGIKGLEFDEVIIIEPEDIAYSAIQGFQDLYVATTRATQGLTILYSGQPIFPIS